VYQVGLYICKPGYSLSPKIEALEFTERRIYGKDSRLTVYYIDGFKESDDELIIRGWAFIGGLNSDQTTTKIVLESEQNKYVLNHVEEIRTDVTRKHSGGNYDKSGFITHITKNKLASGHYGLIIEIYTELGDKLVTKTDKFISINTY